MLCVRLHRMNCVCVGAPYYVNGGAREAWEELRIFLKIVSRIANVDGNDYCAINCKTIVAIAIIASDLSKRV